MQVNLREYAQQDLEYLCKQGMHPVLARILAARDVRHEDELGGGLDQLIPPQQLLGIQEMAQMLADAIVAQEKILIIGDYDCDGATATAVAVKALRRMGAQVDFLVPNRFQYGYGLSPEIVEFAQQFHPKWVVTVDNGIASISGVEKANELGIKVLITDHHLPAQALPQAAAIVNPNQHGCTFPSKNLAGVGVIFYVMMMLRGELRDRGLYQQDTQPNLSDLLDLVALGTVADLVKLDRNNRILVEHGLARMRSGKACAGIRALFQIAARDIRYAHSQDLGFSIGPRINAAGRLEDISLGIMCLLAEHMPEALQLAQRLNDINQQRKSIEQEIKFSAETLLQGQDIQQRSSICLFDADWHHGVIGIVASRIKEAFHRPVIVFAPDEQDLLRGSGRSIPNLHLRDALDAVSKLDADVMIKFGGHAMAAGLSIRPEKFERFCILFEQVVSSLVTPSDLQKTMLVDGSLADEKLDWPLAELLEQQVWGQGFPAPIFCDEFAIKQQKIVGEKHLKLSLQLQSDGQQILDGIYFFQQELLPEQVKLLYQVQTNRFNDRKNIQLQILHVMGA